MTELTNILVPIALSPSCAWAAEYSAVGKPIQFKAAVSSRRKLPARNG